MTMQFEEFEELDDRRQATPVRGQRKSDENNARLKYLLANTPAIIYSSVPTGDFKMTFVSDNAWQVLGYQPAQMVADQNFWFDHIHPDDAPGIFSSLALLFVEGQRSYEYRFLTSDGRYLWMYDTLRLIRDANGDPLEVIGSLTDITDRKQMEQSLQQKNQEQLRLIAQLHETQAQLLQSEKMASVGQLAAGIAHEINNPLSFVNSNIGTLHNYLQTLLKLLVDYEPTLQTLPAEAAARIAQLKKKADIDYLSNDANALIKESMDGLKRVKDIVQALKDFSHVGELDWQMSDIHAGLDSTLMIAGNALPAPIKIEKQYGALPPIKCQASQINQVFMNLLTNAAQAIEHSGTITLRTGCSAAAIWIEISDTGCGIAPEHMNRIFEPFFSTREIGAGTGLGLALSYGIVKQHGGSIAVLSTPGQGSAFTVHLPITPKSA